jgi:hypothetical protein
MTREQLIAAVQQSGFPHLASLIHLFVGGSELHGAKVKDTDDLDIYGVYLEPPELVLGLDKQDFYVWSTAGSERRNGPDDIAGATPAMTTLFRPAGLHELSLIWDSGMREFPPRLPHQPIFYPVATLSSRSLICAFHMT